MPIAIPVIETGVPNLDFVLGGGIPENDTLLVTGDAGAGKTILSLQILFHAARAGRNVLYVSTVSETPLRLLRHLRTMSFFDDSLVGSKVFFLNVNPTLAESLDRLAEAILQEVRAHGVTVLAFDGFDAIRDLHPEAREIRAFLFNLMTVLAAEQVTSILTSSSVRPISPRVERTMVDGILELSLENVGGRTIRYAACPKMRALPHLIERHAMKVDAQGVSVFPRIEAAYVPKNVELGTERVPFGLPELDALMSGGPWAGGSITVAGAVGTGKTLLSLRFLYTGLQRGEKCLFVGFREPPAEIMRMARTLGTDLKPAADSGQLVILHWAPVDLPSDEVVWDVLQETMRQRPQRMVVDSVDEIERAVIPAERRWDFLAALAGWLQDEGVTALFTREITQVVGTELDFAESPLAALTATLILLRWVEFRSQLVRLLSILKMKESAFDSSIRQFVIGPTGIRVLEKVEAAEGLLTGVARLTTRRTRATRQDQDREPK